MLKRIEAGRSYSPQELLEIGLALQDENEMLGGLCQEQTRSLVAQGLLLAEADAASGYKPDKKEQLTVMQGALDAFGTVSRIRLLAEECCGLSVAALRLSRALVDRDLIRLLAEKIADVEILMEHMYVAYPGLVTAMAVARHRKLDHLTRIVSEAARESDAIDATAVDELRGKPN